MQGVVKSFDPTSEIGVILTNRDRVEYPLGPGAIDKSVFTMLRQGQRVNFDIENGVAINVRIGSENDMGISTARV